MSGDRIATVNVLSELCTNLAAGWFGIILISPAALGATSMNEFAAGVGRAFLMGISFAWFAIELRKEASA